MLPGDIQAGVEQKPTRLQLLGCTSRAQAWHWCYRKLQATDKLLLTRSIDVGIEAVACQVGSVIGIQDDVTQWASGGRIQPGSTATALLVDVPGLTFAAGVGWTVSVVHPVVTRGTGTIQSITGTLVTFAANLPAGRIVSIENAAGNVGAVQATGTNTATLDSTFGFAPGQAITFYDQDVLDTQPVSAVSGMTITPTSPFIQTPTQDAPWVYGQSAGAFPAKLFTVTNIKKKGDFSVTLDTIQYDASIYSDDTPIIEGTLGVPDTNAAVTNLIATEQYVTANGANGGVASVIALGWVNGPSTEAVQLWVARNEANQPLSDEELVRTVTKGTTAALTYPTGTILQIRAVGIDSRNMAAPYASAPVVTITVQGSGQAPGDIATLHGFTDSTGTALAWSAPTGAATYEVRYNSDPANTNWGAAQLLYAGSATGWIDSTVRTGIYLVKAVSAAPADVESINAASYTYLQSSSRLNLIGFVPSQSIAVHLVQNELNASGGLCTSTLTAIQQNLTRNDGSIAVTNTSELTWANLQPSTTYTVYTYIDTTNFRLHSGAGDSNLPDTSANSASAAVCSQAGNYPGPVITFTTPSASGTGGSSTTTPGTPPPGPPSNPRTFLNPPP
jgi:hypothetical protein